MADCTENVPKSSATSKKLPAFFLQHKQSKICPELTWALTQAAPL